jgi:hypothetical protein
MKIDGLPIGNNRLSKVNDTQKSSASDMLKRKTVSTERGTTVERDRLEVAGFIVDAEYDPRVDRLESVAQRLTGSGYDSQEVKESIAEKMVEADIVSGLSEDTELVSDVRHEQVKQVDEKISAKYYNTDDVLREIAGRLAPVVGLSDLL